jgi:hypothetical protein
MVNVAIAPYQYQYALANRCLQVLMLGAMPNCALKWRRKQLWVRANPSDNVQTLPPLHHEDWLVDCLKHSTVKVVCLDPQLGAAGLRRWADACEQANKPVFVRLPKLPARLKQATSRPDATRRVAERAIGGVLLMILTPLILLIAGLLRVDAPGSVFFRQWRVGPKGQLFRLIQFQVQDTYRRSDRPNRTLLQRLLWQSSLVKLPQLINVVRGDLKLFGRQPYDLYDAVRSAQGLQHQVISMPGWVGDRFAKSLQG